MDKYPVDPLWVYFRDPTLYFSGWPKDIWEYCLLPFLYDNTQLPLTSVTPQLIGTVSLPESYRGEILMFLRNGDLILSQEKVKGIGRFNPSTSQILWVLPGIDSRQILCHSGLDHLTAKLNNGSCIRINLISQTGHTPSEEQISWLELRHMEALLDQAKFCRIPKNLAICHPLPSGHTAYFYRGYVFQIDPHTRQINLYQYA